MGDVRTCFENHFMRAYGIIKASGVQLRPVVIVDLVPLLYVSADAAATFSGKNRDYLSSEVLKWFLERADEEMNKSLLEEQFNKRIDFYGEVVRGKDLKAYCLWGVSVQEIRSMHPLLRCAVAYIDCLLNIDCIEDYDTCLDAPSDPIGATLVMERTLKPLSLEVVSVFNEIPNIL